VLAMHGTAFGQALRKIVKREATVAFEANLSLAPPP
jgi:hypothetical protein